MSSFVSIRHTKVAMAMISNALFKIKRLINCGVQVFFLAFYFFLLYSNVNSLVYFCLYAGLLAAAISSFCMDLSLYEDANESRKEKYAKKKSRRFYDAWFKATKYILRLGTIVVSVIEIVSGTKTDLAIVVTIVSALLLVIEIMFDVAVKLTTKFISYLRVSIELDLKSSKIVKLGESLSGAPDGAVVHAVFGEDEFKTDEELEALEVIQGSVEPEKEEAAPVDTKGGKALKVIRLVKQVVKSTKPKIDRKKAIEAPKDEEDDS